MNHCKRVVLVVLTAVLIYALYTLKQNQNVSATLSAGDSITIQVEETLPTNKTSDELIAFWRQRVQRNAQDYISYAYLGQALLLKARETGDVDTYARAKAALRQALEINPDYELTLAYLSTVLISQHDFQGALALAERVYNFDPNALQALATIGDANLELGNYDAAATAYQTLLAENPGPPVYSRLSRLTWLQGEPATAINWMQQAVDEAIEAGLTGERLAWYQFQLGELYFNSGDVAAAAKQYENAGQSFENYYLALYGRAKITAANDDLEAAIAQYSQLVALRPQPDFLAALGDLHRLNGQATAAQRQYDTIGVIAELEAANGVLYNRQLALYYANHDIHLDEALSFAEQALLTRADIYAYDALAWTLYKNGRTQEAAAAIDQALSLGTQDAGLYYHAGMIYAGLGEMQQAEGWLQKALTLNPHFDFLQAQNARDALGQIQDFSGGDLRLEIRD